MYPSKNRWRCYRCIGRNQIEKKNDEQIKSEKANLLHSWAFKARKVKFKERRIDLK
jgi:hypothetical protein